jgi:hypothetical protein
VRIRVLPSALLGLGLAALVVAGPRAGADDAATSLRSGLVRLHVTQQGYELTSPWNLWDERTRTDHGVVIADGVILCKASTVLYQRMIEISIANSARRYPARLLHVDPSVGLAKVGYDDPDLVQALRPIALGQPIRLDDEFEIHQLGRDNIPERYEGRVIRAQAGSHELSLLARSTCSDSGDGQAVVKDGQLVGLLIGTYASRQQATILALETVRHYLDAFRGGAYRPAPGSGPWMQTLLRRDLRTYYRLGDAQHGLAVTRVVEGRTGHGVLREGDVLLSIDGYDLDDEGKFVHEVHGRLDSGYLWRGKRYAGETMKARVLRDGEVKELEFPLVGRDEEKERIPEEVSEERPPYLVVGGLVLLELSSRSPISRSPGGVILRRYRERAEWDPPTKRRRIVYADRLYKDEATKGYDWIRHLPLESVNGIQINELADVARALETPEGRYHVFRFEGVESDFVLPSADLAAIDQRIARTYRIPRLRHLGADGG